MFGSHVRSPGMGMATINEFSKPFGIAWANFSAAARTGNNVFPYRAGTTMACEVDQCGFGVGFDFRRSRYMSAWNEQKGS